MGKRAERESERENSHIPSGASHSSNTKSLKTICSLEVGFAFKTPINALEVS
jgi:hypothetical protein